MNAKALCYCAMICLYGHAANPKELANFDLCVARSGGVSPKMLDCGRAEISGWDRRLNHAYQHLLARLPAAQAGVVRRQQRAWLANHRAETRRLAEEPSNGSAAFLDSQAFELKDLSERTLVLEGQVRGAKSQ